MSNLQNKHHNPVVHARHLRRLVHVFVLMSVLTASFAFAGDDPATRRREFYDNLKIMGDVYDKIINNYVDEMDPKEVMEAAIQGMLDELDEHSNYLPPMNYEDLVMSTEGEFGGLGITINIRDHYPTVVSPIEGTPAYYMGIQGGDQIIEIEGESSKDFTSREAVKLLRGKAGTQVNITIKRPGTEAPLPFTITRDIIKIESVPYGFMIDDIGYVRVQNFARSTKDELRVKLDEMTAAGMKGLILDLRFNPGGLLDAAQGVSELFLPKDDLIVFTKGRLRSQNHSFYSESRGKVYNEVPIVVMINGSSASASEIVSAAIQDHDAGLVVGQTSFGKGSVQTVFRLDEDEALKLTTARYYTPSGRSIHKARPRHGDPMEEMGKAMEEDAAEPEGEGEPATEELEMDPAEKELHRFDKEKFYTDGGRVVYGGGGINPDIEIDQDFLKDFEVAVERDGALFGFAVDYAANNTDIPEDYQVSDADYNEFKEFLADREKIGEYLEVFELAYTDSLVDANSEFIKRGMRREVARRLHGPTAAYKVAIEADTQLHEALELFRKAKTLPELLALAEEWNAEQMRLLAAEGDGDGEEEESVSN
ncbi:MAG: S41 family peptidase [Candidatus Krumholzibacteria bacterium]|nr:S41 family peptidase [Candidatus Krumholzibacteria bacterium]